MRQNCSLTYNLFTRLSWKQRYRSCFVSMGYLSKTCKRYSFKINMHPVSILWKHRIVPVRTCVRAHVHMCLCEREVESGGQRSDDWIWSKCVWNAASKLSIQTKQKVFARFGETPIWIRSRWISCQQNLEMRCMDLFIVVISDYFDIYFMKYG